MIIENIGVMGCSAKREDLERGLRSLLGPMRAEEGCVDCRLFQDSTDANAFHLQTCWSTEADLTRHVRSKTYKKLLILVEMGAEPPTIEFHEVSRTRGLDFIQAVRQA